MMGIRGLCVVGGGTHGGGGGVGRPERIWVDSACLGAEERVYLKLWVKPGCSPRYTQMVPK